MKGHILTIEDPIEFVHQRKNCLISQREVGVHSPTFAEVPCTRRCAKIPTSCLVGELRDLRDHEHRGDRRRDGHPRHGHAAHERRGRHRGSHRQRVSRPTSRGTSRPCCRPRCAASISQQLFPRDKAAGRVAALEILVNTPAVANLIRQGKLDQLENTMQSGAAKACGRWTGDPGAARQGHDHRQGRLQEGHQQGEVRADQDNGPRASRADR